MTSPVLNRAYSSGVSFHVKVGYYWKGEKLKLLLRLPWIADLYREKEIFSHLLTNSFPFLGVLL